MSHQFITHSDDGDELYLKTPYNEEFRDKMKDLVDRDSRKWDAEAKHWIIDPAYEELLEQLVRDYWGSGQRGNAKRTAKASPTISRRYASTKRSREVPDPIGSVDDYIERIAREDVSHVIKELTAKVGALTYELDDAKRQRTTAQSEANRLRAANQRDQRTINELTYKLQTAEMMGAASGAMPFRGGRPLNGKAGAYDVLHLKPDAPPEVIKAAQRALAQLHHPDHGGDEARMKAINNAVDEILGKG